MDYSLRQLKSDDIFILTSIISKIGYKEFKNCFNNPEVKNMLLNNGSKEVDANALGMVIAFDVIGIILENMVKVKDDLYSFLSSLTGISKKELSELPPSVFMQMIFDVVKKEEFADFFQAVAKFLK